MTATLVRVPGDDAYAEAFDPVAYGLKRPARFEEYRGFWFMCLDEDVMPLADYLGTPRTTSTSSSTSRRRARWRSSPACRNTTSPPTGS